MERLQYEVRDREAFCVCDRMLYTLDEGHFSGFSLHCRSTFRDAAEGDESWLAVLFRQCGNSFVVELDEHPRANDSRSLA